MKTRIESLAPPLAALVIASLAAAGCGDETSGPEKQALSDVTTYIKTNISDLADASAKLQAAAPAPDADGWNATSDAAAVAEMKTQWKRARVAYERIEGAVAVLFGEIDYSTDQRYDAFLADNGADTNLYDDQNVTGIHAIERILWSDEIPARVTTFEQALPGYQTAAFPTTSQQADDFKNKLCARLAIDVRTMQDEFGSAVRLDPAAAFRGVIGSMGEQLEKADLAATGQEESRYAQFTLSDMRTNVDAGIATFQAFQPWLKSRMMGQGAVDRVMAAFQRVDDAYEGLPGDSLPPVPATWSSQQPSEADLASPFGTLWSVLHREADPDTSGTLVSEMNGAAMLLGIPELPP